MSASIAALALAACTGAPEIGACKKGPDPTLQIGLGVEGYSELQDEFPLVHGPQGGYHLEIGLLATHIDASDLVTAHIEGTLDGEPYVETDPWLDFRCDEEQGGLISWGTRLIYGAPPEVTPEMLDGESTEVTVTVTDLSGDKLTASSTFTIRDLP